MADQSALPSFAIIFLSTRMCQRHRDIYAKKPTSNVQTRGSVSKENVLRRWGSETQTFGFIN